jgi:rod shape-determining protein MreC
MFSRKTLLIVGLILLLAANVIGLTLSGRSRDADWGLGQVGLALVAPFQAVVSYSLRWAGDVWRHYFVLVNTARENDHLKKELARAWAHNDRLTETVQENRRLRRLLDFQQAVGLDVLPAEVIGKDPSPWFRSVIIDKGRLSGVRKGQPVVTAQGIAGQVAEVAERYAKVLLIIDQNTAVDTLVQRSRARGLVTGTSDERCIFKYVVRQDDVQVGDVLISSGLDGVFPKGLKVGSVSAVEKAGADIFQEVMVAPSVDFATLEEVLVIRSPPRPEVPEE